MDEIPTLAIKMLTRSGLVCGYGTCLTNECMSLQLIPNEQSCHLQTNTPAMMNSFFLKVKCKTGPECMQLEWAGRICCLSSHRVELRPMGSQTRHTEQKRRLGIECRVIWYVAIVNDTIAAQRRFSHHSSALGYFALLTETPLSFTAETHKTPPYACTYHMLHVLKSLECRIYKSSIMCELFPHRLLEECKQTHGCI